MTRNHIGGILIFCFLLTGCAGMPISSMFKLRKMNPLMVDPAQLKVAIRTDERIGIPEEGVKLSLKFDAADGSVNIDDTYAVEVIRNPILTPELVDGKAAWESVTVLQLSDSDARRLTRVQSVLKPYMEGRASGSLSFGVDIKGLCVHSPISAGNVLIDIFVRASDTDEFFAVSRGLDFGGGNEGMEVLPESLPACVESLR